MPHYVLSAILALLLVACMSSKQSGHTVPTLKGPLFYPVSRTKPGLKPSIEMKTLENGLRVAILNTHEGDWTSARVRVNSGFMHERQDGSQVGIAHHLEHMLLRGSQKNPEPDSFRQLITKLGGHNNASTWFDRTQYFVQVPKENLLTAMEHLADIFVTPKFPEEVILKEVKAVMNEGSQRLNHDWIRLYEDQFRLTRHPNLNRYFFGTDENLKRYHHQDFVRFFGDHYSADNMVLVVAGNLDNIEVAAAVKTWFGQITRKQKQSEKKVPIFRAWENGFQVLEEKTTNNTNLALLTIPGPDYKDPLYFAGKMMISFINQSRANSLMTRLVEEGFVNSLEIDTESFDEFASYIAMLELTEKGFQEIESVEELVFEYFENLKTLAFGQSFIDDMVKTIRIHEELAQSDAMGYASHLAELIAKFDVDSPEAYLKMYESVTPEMLKTVVASYFKPDSMLLSVASPYFEKGSVDKDTGRLLNLRDASGVLARLKSPKKSGLFKTASVPRKNPFLTDIRIDPIDGEDGVPVFETYQHAHFIYQENHRKSEQATVVYLKKSKPINTLDRLALNLLFQSFVKQNRDLFTEISLSGRSLGLSYNDVLNAITFQVDGLSFGHNRIILEVAQEFLRQTVDKKYVEEALRQAIFEAQSDELSYAYRKVLYGAAALTQEGGVLNREKIGLLDGLTVDYILSKKERLLDDVSLYIGAYGDLHPKDLQILTDQLAAHMRVVAPISLPVDAPYFSLKPRFQRMKVMVHDNTRSGFARYYEGPHYDENPSDAQLKDFLSFQVLRTYLGKKSFDQIRTEEGLAYAVGAVGRGITLMHRASRMLMFASTESGKNGYRKLKNSFDSLLKGIKEKGFEDADFQSAKGKIIAELSSQPQSYAERLDRILSEQLTLGKFGSYQKLIDIAKAIAIEDMAPSFDRYVWDQSYLEFVVLGKEDKIDPSERLIFSQKDIN